VDDKTRASPGFCTVITVWRCNMRCRFRNVRRLSEMIRIFLEKDLPSMSVGAGHPNFILTGVATGDIHFVKGGKTRLFQTFLRSQSRFGGSRLDPQMIDATVGCPTLVQGEVEGRFIGVELRMTGAHFGRFFPEQLTVKPDRGVQILYID